MVDRGLQESNLGIILDNGGFRFTNTFFIYTSGEIGPYFVNGEVVVKNPIAFYHSIESLKHYATEIIGKDKFDVISGGESRDWIFSDPLAIHPEIKKPLRIIYKNGKTLGADVEGKRVLHVSDLNNEGSSPRDLWVPSIRRDGGIIEHYLSYVDRLEKGVGVLKGLGIQSYAVVPLDEIAWNKMLEWGRVEEEVYKNIRERAENQDAWGLKMLRSEAGSKRLKDLLEDDKTKDGANKVMDYYCNLDEELIEIWTRNGVKL